MTYFKLTNCISKKLFPLSMATILLLACSTVNAAPPVGTDVPAITVNKPGTLASQPLHTAATAEPNIVFLLDNSQSMNSNSITTDSVTKTRFEWLKVALHDIVPELSGVRIAMFTFDNGNGSQMRAANSAYDMRLLDKTAGDYDTIKGYFTGASGTINSLATGSGGTVLAESLQDIGRFYANDSSEACGGGNDLTIHPKSTPVADGGLKEDVDCTALLGAKANIINKPQPIAYSCQKSFAIVMSDGETRKDTGLRSDGATYDDTSKADGTNFSNNDKPDHPFRDYDQDCSGTAPADGGYTCDTHDPRYDQKVSGTKDYNYNGTGGTDFLDDVAQALYEIDLRPDYGAFHNNVTTYTIGFAEGILNPTHTDYNPLMESAAEQAGGSYFYASDSAALVSSFNSAVTSILAQVSSAAALSFNSSSLSSNSAVYKARFSTSSWYGELNSYPLDPITAQINKDCVSGTDANCWDAQSKLNAQTAGTANGTGNRFILTYNGTYGTDFTSPSDYTNLTSSTDIPQALVDDLCQGREIDFPCNASTAADTSDGGMKEKTQEYIDDLVAYLRGDNTKEETAPRNFRKRDSDLGDIVNSTPVFVGNPSKSWKNSGFFPPWSDVPTSDKSYSTWKKTTTASGGPKDRDEIVYVAANDGMLHGFRASESSSGAGDEGTEVIAYYPTAIFSSETNKGLHYLANKDYSHLYYNDLSPTVTDVYMEYKDSDGAATGTPVIPTKNSSTAKWRTVLMGGLRGGGKGYYLLDVTDPTRYVAGKEDELVLWEFNGTDDSDLGYTYSKPIIAMLNNGQFAAIFGNGYNSTSCEAKLFVVPLDSGVDGTWTYTAANAGEYFKFSTSGASPDGTCNGLSSPAVYDIDGNGTADRVYAGDLQGNMWAFNLCALSSGVCASTPGSWKTSGGSAGGGTGVPLMTAHNTDQRQAITVRPVVSKDPNGNSSDDLIIVFGTGQYITNLDTPNTDTQTMYGVRDWDTLAGTFTNNNLNPRDTSPDNWRRLTLSIDDTTGKRKIDNPAAMSSSDYGWIFDLPVSGERLVSRPNARDDIVYFNTIVPDSTKCSYGGKSWRNSIDVASGGPPPKSTLDTNNNNSLGDDDKLDDGTFAVGEEEDGLLSECTFIGDNCGESNSNDEDEIREIPASDASVSGRMSWKELFGDE